MLLLQFYNSINKCNTEKNLDKERKLAWGAVPAAVFAFGKRTILNFLKKANFQEIGVFNSTQMVFNAQSELPELRHNTLRRRMFRFYVTLRFPSLIFL